MLSFNGSEPLSSFRKAQPGHRMSGRFQVRLVTCERSLEAGPLSPCHKIVTYFSLSASEHAQFSVLNEEKNFTEHSLIAGLCAEHLNS